jgi:hypothetical protein
MDQDSWLELAAAPLQSRGAGYFNARGATHGEEASSRFLIADDHGEQRAAIAFAIPDAASNCCAANGSCRPGLARYSSSSSARVFSDLISSDAADGADAHRYGCGDELDATATHELLDCAGDCPSVWPPFADYDAALAGATDDAAGQPKQLALLERDFSRRPPEPWEQSFRFGAAGRLDLTGGPARKQRAVATGIAYYHRFGATGSRWREPPNLLNPFWRATLVPWNIDAQGSADLDRVLVQAGASDAALAYRALTARGYRGAK